MIGTSLALIGSVFGALVGLYIRKISNYAKLHFLVSPMGFVLGNLALCPVFMTLRVLYIPVDPVSAVLRESNPSQLGSSLHVYSWYDVSLIFLLALMIYFA